MRPPRLLLPTLALGLTIAAGAAEPDAVAVRPAGDATWLYQIGGATPYAPNHFGGRTARADLGGDISWSLLNNCAFDPRHSIQHSFNNIQENLYGMTQTLIGSAKSLAAAWGLSKIREANPGLYDFLVKGARDAKENYLVSVKSCERMMGDVNNGRDPVEGWVGYARQQSWKDAQAGHQSATEAAAEVKKNGGDTGFPWPTADGGNRGGGKTQPPARVIGDTLRQGMAYAEGDDPPAPDPASPAPADGTPPASPTPTPAGRRAQMLFGGQDAAVDWVVTVVGEKTVRTCQGCERLRTRPGQGLRGHVETETVQLLEDLQALVVSPHTPTAAALDAVSVPGMGIVITRPVIVALRKELPAEQVLLTQRLASEAALARTLEKALVSRDLLRAGAQHPDIAANSEAQADINAALARLDEDAKNILFEQEVRAAVLNNTAALLVAREQARSLAPQGAAQADTPAPPRTLGEGGVVRESP